ncbi:AbrB/MazE/SpoVT family DNA-binding domain-containing protein [Rhizorhabdus argentea]|uniref:AbrB/MazE/SpoVT family DNA-binding domain-containing protein n=1 Tax=Rhizorhabdus argentea TaxID=1387174 RepID=UPI0030EF7C91
MGMQERLTTVLSTKGQVILPKAIRDQMHWAPGTRLTVEHTPAGVLLKASPIFPPATIDELFGSLGYDGAPLSLDDMDAAIAEEARRRARD